MKIKLLLFLIITLNLSCCFKQSNDPLDEKTYNRVMWICMGGCTLGPSSIASFVLLGLKVSPVIIASTFIGSGLVGIFVGRGLVIFIEHKRETNIFRLIDKEKVDTLNQILKEKPEKLNLLNKNGLTALEIALSKDNTFLIKVISDYAEVIDAKVIDKAYLAAKNYRLSYSTLKHLYLIGSKKLKIVIDENIKQLPKDLNEIIWQYSREVLNIFDGAIAV